MFTAVVLLLLRSEPATIIAVLLNALAATQDAIQGLALAGALDT